MFTRLNTYINKRCNIIYLKNVKMKSKIFLKNISTIEEFLGTHKIVRGCSQMTRNFNALRNPKAFFNPLINKFTHQIFLKKLKKNPRIKLTKLATKKIFISEIFPTIVERFSVLNKCSYFKLLQSRIEAPFLTHFVQMFS